MSRESDISRYDQLYRFFHYEDEEPFTCFYCGDRADGVDHCPPITRVDDYRALQPIYEDYVKVICCFHCNSILGDTLQISLIDREQYLKSWLAENQTIVSVSDEEIKTMGRNLKRRIKRWKAMEKQIEERLQYNKGINAYIDMAEVEFPDIFLQEP